MSRHCYLAGPSRVPCSANSGLRNAGKQEFPAFLPSSETPPNTLGSITRQHRRDQPCGRMGRAGRVVDLGRRDRDVGVEVALAGR